MVTSAANDSEGLKSIGGRLFLSDLKYEFYFLIFMFAAISLVMVIADKYGTSVLSRHGDDNIFQIYNETLVLVFVAIAAGALLGGVVTWILCIIHMRNVLRRLDREVESIQDAV